MTWKDRSYAFRWGILFIPIYLLLAGILSLVVFVVGANVEILAFPFIEFVVGGFAFFSIRYEYGIIGAIPFAIVVIAIFLARVFAMGAIIGAIYADFFKGPRMKRKADYDLYNGYDKCPTCQKGD